MNVVESLDIGVWRRLMSNESRTELRMTSNRRVVLNVLRSMTTHPTARQVFLAAREHLPQLGSATVYHTLDLLVRCGLAQEIFRDRYGVTHYDSKVARHDHAICNNCGRIEDVSMPVHALAFTVVERMSGFRLHSHATVVTGLCMACAADAD